MKISLIGPVYPYKGGIAHFTTFLAHSLDRNEHETSTISFKRLYPLWLYPGVTDKDPSLEPPWPLKAEYPSDPLLPWTWPRTSRRLQEIKPDVIVFQWWTTFLAPMLFYLMRILRKADVDIIFLVHNVYPHETRPWHRWISRALLSRVNKFIVQSQSELEKLRSIRPEAEIMLREHPLYLWPELKILPRKDAKQKLNIDTTENMLLFFGIVRPYKGLENMLYAAQILKEKGIKFQLVVVGEFWEDFEHYREIIQKIDVEDFVTLQNKYVPHDQLNLYFSAADIFVAPYVGGTQSGVVKTAMAYDLPVVGSHFIIPEDSAFFQKDRHVHIHTLDPQHIAATIEIALQSEIASLPRVTPEWEQSGWDKLVEAIDRLSASGRSVNVSAHER